MDKEQYGRWGIGVPYSGGGGTKYGTYEKYCDEVARHQPVGPFEPMERTLPQKSEEKKVKDLTISELKEIIRKEMQKNKRER